LLILNLLNGNSKCFKKNSLINYFQYSWLCWCFNQLYNYLNMIYFYVFSVKTNSIIILFTNFSILKLFKPNHFQILFSLNFYLFFFHKKTPKLTLFLHFLKLFIFILYGHSFFVFLLTKFSSWLHRLKQYCLSLLENKFGL